jgi:hypothetical protein
MPRWFKLALLTAAVGAAVILLLHAFGYGLGGHA